MSDNTKAIQTYVSDMLAVERHILEPVEHQVNDGDVQKFAAAHATVQRVHGVISAHVAALDAHLAALGGHPSAPLKTAVGSVLGAAASVVNAVRRTEVSKGLRDTYTALAMDSIAYTMLHTTALALRDHATAAMAEKHLEDVTPLIIELSRVIPSVVVDELKAEGLDVDSSVKEAATTNTQSAWH